MSATVFPVNIGHLTYCDCVDCEPVPPEYSLTCVAGGILVPGVLSWPIHSKRAAKPGTQPSRGFAAKKIQHANPAGYAG